MHFGEMGARSIRLRFPCTRHIRGGSGYMDNFCKRAGPGWAAKLPNVASGGGHVTVPRHIFPPTRIFVQATTAPMQDWEIFSKDFMQRSFRRGWPK
jgi:hypothetical protein